MHSRVMIFMDGKGMGDFYDSIAQGYEELHGEEQREKVRLIASLMKKHGVVCRGRRVLDVGCGTGVTTIPWDGIVVGVDPARKLLERARRRRGVHYVLAQAEDLPFADGAFDVVVSVTAAQNFHDAQRAFREMHRVGKGSWIISFLKKSAKRDALVRDIRMLWDVKEVIEQSRDMVFVCVAHSA